MMAIESPRDLAQLMGTPYLVSDQQWAAITAPLAPAVVIAGAGSGKTTLMAARVVYLVATGQVAPDEVLGLTFTTKAAEALTSGVRKALVDAGLGEPGEDEEEHVEPTVATYNAYAASLLTEHGLRIGFEPDTRVLADASRYQLAERVVAKHTAAVVALSDHPPTVVKNMLALESALSEHLVSAQMVLEHDDSWRDSFAVARAEELEGKGRVGHLKAIDHALNTMDRRAELLELIGEYRVAKQRLGLMDFSEQIERAAALVSQHREVAEAERAKFKVVLLDEYQDTSVAQAILLKRLFGQGHAVTAVGDPNQAIYGWRGASVSNIIGFAEDFPHPDGVPIYPLTVSRRSAPLILAAANHVAAPLYSALPMVAPLDAAPEKVGGDVRVVVHQTQGEELNDLADRVKAAHQQAGEWREIGVLTRDNRTAEAAFDVLSHAGVPVEIVGLSGLLRLPEVAQVLALLRLVHDVTANADLLTVLSGPRWAIGPRDLALLGRRSKQLADASHTPVDGLSVDDELAVSVVGSDPTEVASISEALADPGDLDYSALARERFALLAGELRTLRAYVGEPLLDLVRRIIDVTGIDVELASSLSPAAAARRDNLDLFVKAIADFEGIDGQVNLAALLAWLEAEDEFGNGLDAATPSAADSVKLLTVHRAKGLEWRSVFLVGVCEDSFPSTTSRPLWVTSPAVLPSQLRGDARDLPHLQGHTKEDIDHYRAAGKAHDQTEERRLAYVALTRAAQSLSVSSYVWGQRATPFGPSIYQRELADFLGGAEQWIDRPPRNTPNPLLAEQQRFDWPIDVRTEETQARLEAAEMVRARQLSAVPDVVPDSLDVAAHIAEWDADLERLVAEALADSGALEVSLPLSMSATALAQLRDNEAEFARDLARPMPRQPSASARFGTRFHAWIESRFGQLGLLDPDDLPGRADADIDDDEDLRELIHQFSTGPFAERRPAYVEAPFALAIAGQVIRGRIDAVYAEGDDWLLIDWKTNRSHSADPLQLAIYQQAWAELRGVAPERVKAGFHYVRTGSTVFPDLPTRADIEQLLDGER